MERPETWIRCPDDSLLGHTTNELRRETKLSAPIKLKSCFQLGLDRRAETAEFPSQDSQFLNLQVQFLSEFPSLKPRAKTFLSPHWIDLQITESKTSSRLAHLERFWGLNVGIAWQTRVCVRNASDAWFAWTSWLFWSSCASVMVGQTRPSMYSRPLD